MQEIFLGWDVGAWHCERNPESQDALCALALNGNEGPHLIGRPWRGGLRQTMNAHEGQDLIRALLDLVEVGLPPGASVTVAIDTPLGWPKTFTELLTHRRIPNSIQDMQRKNQILYRKTERLLIRNGHRPLSVVQDMISSQSTKGMFFLARAGLERVQPGVWAGKLEGGAQITTIETYPSPCRECGSVAERFDEISQEERFAGAYRDRKSAEQDVKDSLYCALVAFLHTKQPEDLLAPSQVGSDVPPEEGWIWVPKGCYPNLSGNG